MNKSLKQILQNITPDGPVCLDLMANYANNCAKAIKSPVTILLWGALGAGKTTFVQHFIRTLIPGAEVTSPTFNLIHLYDEAKPPLLHADLYRLESVVQIEETGFYDLLVNHIALVEWPERLGGKFPKNAVHLHIDILSDTVRKVRVA